MAKLGDVLGRQFKKLGIDVDDSLKPLIELDTEIPDATATQIDKGLLTLEAAKTNPEVNKMLKQSILAGADNKMDELIKEHGIIVDDTFVNEKNTYEKIAMVLKAGIQTGFKKGEANSKEGVSEVLKKEREAWTAKEADFQLKLKTAGETLTAKDGEVKTITERNAIDVALFKKLFPKDYAFPKDMDADLKVGTALSAINKDLTAKGLFTKLDASGNLTIVDKDGNKAYTEKHEPIENADSYFDAILTHNKMLNINDPNDTSNKNNGSDGTIVIEKGKGNQAIVNEITDQLYK